MIDRVVGAGDVEFAVERILVEPRLYFGGIAGVFRLGECRKHHDSRMDRHTMAFGRGAKSRFRTAGAGDNSHKIFTHISVNILLTDA